LLFWGRRRVLLYDCMPALCGTLCMSLCRTLCSAFNARRYVLNLNFSDYEISFVISKETPISMGHPVSLLSTTTVKLKKLNAKT
jgi:hypothetical protein